jgi:hypothetical protein
MEAYDRDFDSTGSSSTRSFRNVLTLFFLLFLLISWLTAENGDAAEYASGASGSTWEEPGEARADFLFGQPKGYFGFRVGMFFPRAGSDLFDMVTRELTLGKSDFRSWDLAIDAGFNLFERIDLVFRFDFSEASKSSEFRDYVDEQGLAITQTTDFFQTSITAGIRYLFAPRGRGVGKYAWLPNRFVPFVEAGGGALLYRFEQDGDFVDSTTLEIFPAHMESSDWAPVGYLGGGVDIHLYRSLYATLDLRYSWSERSLSGSFSGFDPIDLSGFRATTGISCHY